MSGYDGGQSPVDSSGWKRPVNSIKDGEAHPEPSDSSLDKRAVTPDPYLTDSPHVKRNFGRKRR